MYSKRITQSLILATLALMLSSCGAQENQLDATSWTLEAYRDASGNTVEVMPDSTISAYFQADQVSGSAGCNNYSASYQAGTRSISFGPAATTRKMCALPAGIMEQESAFLSALESAAGYKISGDTLKLTDEKGDEILHFLRATAN